MKTIVAISGSASSQSSNAQLLHIMSETFAKTYHIAVYDELWKWPLYSPESEQSGVPTIVQQLRTQLATADAVIICTPEYVHNIPAALKNMLEWVTTSGELHEKAVLPITFTPAAPRGQYAMVSLLQSLRACNAKIVTELPLYKNELALADGTIGLHAMHLELVTEALHLL